MSGVLASKSGQARNPVSRDIRSLLRRATQRDHNRLHSSSLLGPLILPSVTLAQYHAAMIAMLHTYAQIDACLLHSSPLDRTYRARSIAIQSDLDALGIEPGAMIPHPGKAPNLPVDLPTYLGMRYVVEGSQFGNRMISRNLRAVFGPAADNICKSWRPTVTADEDWKNVMAALSALDTQRDIAAALRGARSMFRYFVIAFSDAK